MRETQEDIYSADSSQPLTIRTMSGELLDFPELPSADSPPPEAPTELDEIIQDVHKWSNPRLTYLASADQWLGFEAFFKKNDIMQCDVFYCAIGGLGGLNLLPGLNSVEKIVFYDVNAYATRILDLQLQLIRHSTSVNEYISLIYQRPFDSSKYNFHNQTEFLKLPVEQSYESRLQEILSLQAYETYEHFYLPYVLQLPSPLYDGPTIHCTHLLPFFESDELTDPLVSGPFSNTSINVNTFYVGKGWLSSDKTFLAVRSRLLESEIEVLIGDIAEVKPTGKFPGIYITNIYNTAQCDGYKQFIHLFGWIIGYDDNADFEVQYYPDDIIEGMVEYEKCIGAGNGNPHATCCQAIDNLLDLNANEFLEVIEPHPTEGMKYGFQHYKGQKRISVEDYLKTNVSDEQIIGVHILLGGGASQQAWRDVCHKAVRESKRYVLIFEHRKECTNWPARDVHSDNLLSHRKLDQFIYSLDHRWKKYGMPNTKGDINDIRNIFYFLDKDGENDIYESGSEVTYTDVQKSRIEACELFKKGMNELRAGNSEEALNCFNQARLTYPRIPNLRFAIATAYAQLGDICSAREACEVELALDPHNDSTKKLLEKIEKAVSVNYQPGGTLLIPETRKIDKHSRIQVIGTKYGSCAVVLDIIPTGSTVISAGVGEDISFDRELVRLKNCRIIGIDPTEKARRYIENNPNENFYFMQKALYCEGSKRIKIYKNTNPDYVSESITPSHNMVSASEFYEAETVSIPELLSEYRDVSLLKLDIEGAEYGVLTSISKLDIPQIYVEFHHFCTDYTPDETIKCIKHLNEIGYVIVYGVNQGGALKDVTFVHHKYINEEDIVQVNAEEMKAVKC